MLMPVTPSVKPVNEYTIDPENAICVAAIAATVAFCVISLRKK